MLKAFAMPLLQRTHVDFISLQGSNAFSGGPGSGHGCNGRYAIGDSGPPDGFFVEPGLGAVGRVDHKLNAVALDEVNHIGTAFFYFVDAVDVETGALQSIGGAMRGYEREAHLNEPARQFNGLLLVAVNHADKDGSSRRERLPGGKLGFGKGLAECVG